MPDEILSDRGSNFFSELMGEIERLLSLHQLTATPYHPKGDGMVGKFNGTLATMLQRMCAEQPKDWDRYLSPLLFAYREVPRANLGLLPFELVYLQNGKGRY